jgi:Uma2 family endonuclease
MSTAPSLPAASPPAPRKATNGWTLRIPTSALTVAGFRVWARSDDYPERGQISLIGKELFIDMSPERQDSHNAVKTEITVALGGLVQKEDLGRFYADRMLIVNEEAELSNEPDAMFVSWASRESGRCRVVISETDDGEITELQGSPDWVLEIVSAGSVRKDTHDLREAYRRAGVLEYWLIDARGDAVQFEMLLHEPDGYVAAQRRGDWQRSRVFGRLFLLERGQDRLGEATYRLRSRRR